LTGTTATITSGIIASGTAALPSLAILSDPNTGIYSPGADQLAISTGGSGRLFVDASGVIKTSGTEIQQTTASNYIRISGSDGAGNGANIIAFGESHSIAPGRIAVSAVGTGEIIASTGGAERLRITSAGLVGIGTSSPAQLFHLKGSGDVKLLLNSSNNASDRGIYFATGTDSEVLGYIKQEYATGKFEISSGSGSYAAAIHFRTGGVSDRVIINSSGNVGIGTASPGAKFQVTDALGDIQIDGGSINANRADGFYLQASSYLRIYTNGAERARIDSSGRLLVGTSTARSNFFNDTNSARFQVEGADNDGSAIAIVQNFNSNTLGAQLILAKSNLTSLGSNTLVANGDRCGTVSFQGNDGTQFVEAAVIRGEIDGTPGADDMPGRLVFSTTADGASSPSERMRITAVGEVKLNTGVPIIVPYAFATTTASAANAFIGSDGNIFRSTSSRRWKTDIEDLRPEYADNILNCRPVWYRSTSNKDNPEWGYWGFIAEEVAKIDPRLVFWSTQKTVEDNDGNQTVVELENPLAEGVQYDRFVPHLLNIIKRQGEAIADLQAEVAALKAQ